MSNLETESNKKKMYFWISVIILFVINLVIGILGYQHYFELHGEPFGFARSFYRTLQLFTMEGGDFDAPIPVLLHVVRFTAPLVTIGAVILALWEIFEKQWKRWRISRMKNHIVIIGLGTKGKNIMAESLEKEKKAKVLVIEKDPLNPHLASLKNRRCRHIIGSASNIDILKKARINHAKQVHLMMGDDSQQVQTCVLIYDLIKEMNRDKGDPLECNMHLLKHEYLDILRKHRLVQNINDGLSLNVFNLYENSARELFQEHKPDRSGISETSTKYVQLIILGFGHAGEALALQCALTGHYLNRKNKIFPQVVIFDRDAKNKVEEFKKRYPTYDEYCHISDKAIEANSPQLIPELEKYLKDPEALNTIVLCFDNKINNLMLGLQIDGLSPSTPSIPFQVFIRTDDNESIDAISKNLKPYGLPSSVCSLNAITGCDLDEQAKAVHADFHKTRKTNKSFGTQASDVDWDELPQEYRDSNRKAADHIGVKMRGIGCQIVSAKDDPREPTEFTTSEVDLLAELEHYRWNAERSLAGWTLGEVKSEENRKTPYLVEWDDLPEKIQQYDRDAVENIPNVLNEAGLKIVR